MYQKIEKWIDKVLQQDFPDDVVAVMFNLYEDGDALYSMEVVGTESFDEEDEDWACDELTDFETRENPRRLGGNAFHRFRLPEEIPFRGKTCRQTEGLHRRSHRIRRRRHRNSIYKGIASERREYSITLYI